MADKADRQFFDTAYGRVSIEMLQSLRFLNPEEVRLCKNLGIPTEGREEQPTVTYRAAGDIDWALLIFVGGTMLLIAVTGVVMVWSLVRGNSQSPQANAQFLTDFAAEQQVRADSTAAWIARQPKDVEKLPDSAFNAWFADAVWNAPYGVLGFAKGKLFEHNRLFPPKPLTKAQREAAVRAMWDMPLRSLPVDTEPFKKTVSTQSDTVLTIPDPSGVEGSGK